MQVYMEAFPQVCKLSDTFSERVCWWHVTLISTDVDARTSVLQTNDRKAADLDLSFKPAWCISYLLDGSKIIPQGISLSKGTTRSIVEGAIKFLGKVMDLSLSATKRLQVQKWKLTSPVYC